MALQKDWPYKLVNGLDPWGDQRETDGVVRDVYIKVEAVVATKNRATAGVSFAKSSGDGLLKFPKNYSFVVSLDGKNFIEQAYEHLKTLPEFQNARDV